MNEKKQNTTSGLFNITLLILLVGLTSIVQSCIFPQQTATPIVEPVDVQNTAVAAAMTIVAETQAVLPTITPVPPTETPSPTPTLDPLVVNPIITAIGPVWSPTSSLAASSSNQDPCNQLITSWDGPTANFTVSNETDPMGDIILLISIDSIFGECGYLNSKNENNFSGPVGYYTAGAFVDNNNIVFTVYGGFFIKSEGSYHIIVNNDEVYALGDDVASASSTETLNGNAASASSVETPNGNVASADSLGTPNGNVASANSLGTPDSNVSPANSIAIPNSLATLQALFRKTDEELAKAIDGHFTFNKPSQMKLGESTDVKLTISLSRTQSELATQFVTEGGFITSTADPDINISPEGIPSTFEIDQIKITPEMKASLSSIDPEAFFITRHGSDEIQAISSLEDTNWTWSVSAQKEGVHTLVLVIEQLVKYDGKDDWREVGSYKAEIVVNVTAADRLKSLDWKWTATFALTLVGSVIGVLSWLGTRNKKIEREKPARKSKKKKNHD